MARPVLVGSVSAVGTTTGYQVSLSGTLTGGIAASPGAGDVLLVPTGFGGTAQSAPAVTGNNSGAFLQAHTPLFSNDTWDTNFGIFYQRMGATPDTILTITRVTNAAYGGAVTVQVWRGVDPNTPLDVATVTAIGNNSQYPNPPAITPVTPDAVIIVGAAVALSTTGSATSGPAGMANIVAVKSDGTTSDMSVAIASYDWTSGAYDPATMTGGGAGASSSWCAATLALRPAPGPVTADGVASVGVTAGGTATVAVRADGVASVDVTASGEASQLGPVTADAALVIDVAAGGTATAAVLADGSAAVQVSAVGTASVAVSASGAATIGVSAEGGASIAVAADGVATIGIAADSTATVAVMASAAPVIEVAVEAGAAVMIRADGAASVDVTAEGSASSASGGVTADGAVFVPIGAAGTASVQVTGDAAALIPVAIEGGATATVVAGGAAAIDVTAGGMALVSVSADGATSISITVAGTASIIDAAGLPALDVAGVWPTTIEAAGVWPIEIIAAGQWPGLDVTGIWRL